MLNLDWDILQLMQMTWIGGPTMLLEREGLRLLTDPTIDAAGSEITYGEVTLRKTAGPAMTSVEVGPVDAVLLSHDQHSDNLDRLGREFLPQARTVLTTKSGAVRLDGNAVGLVAWELIGLTG
jgi:L-ascorbate metabolism protein UlaG (beta-lactamase superfamily)